MVSLLYSQLLKIDQATKRVLVYTFQLVIEQISAKEKHILVKEDCRILNPHWDLNLNRLSYPAV